jgi:hypothetical protein
VDAIEPMTKMLMCGVVEVGVRPTAAKRNVASVKTAELHISLLVPTG